MTKTSKLLYAKDVNPQVNPNTTKRVSWSNIANAVNHTDKYATSSYTKKGTTKKDKNGKKTTTYTYNYPWKVTAHDFRFNIPSCAYISKITVGVRMKTSKSGTGSTFPSVGFYISDKKANTQDAKKNQTGWHNGTYWVTSDKKLSKSFATAKYEMSHSDFVKGGYSISNLNSSYCGVDLNFAEENEDQTIYLKWVWMEIEYEVPSFSTSETWKTTPKSRKQIPSGFEYSVTYTVSQTSKANGGTRNLKLDVPWGVDLTGASPSGGSFDYSNNTWSVNFNGKKSYDLDVNFRDYTINDQQMSLMSENFFGEGTVCKPKIIQPFYFKTTRGIVDGYNELHIDYASEDAPHKGEICCFSLTSKNQSDDDELYIDIWNSEDFDVSCIALDGAFCHDDVEILSTNLESFTLNDDGFYKEGQVYGQTRYVPENTPISVKLKVPSDIEFRIGMTICARPHTVGNNTLNATARDSGKQTSYPYEVLDPYSYHIGSTTNDTDTEKHYLLDTDGISFTNHRIASELETGAFVLPCRVKDGDSVMTQGQPQIHMYKWEQIDYIGCVPLEHLHFDPKSTYKDSLLDNHYKNKRYMGKQLASDEDITLNVRLHPPQVTTIQGLIDMDKPIPINANHRCFEGDSLNHRGWAEIYGVKTEQTGNNPHWYKCDIDVKYLTHNLNTRFKINRGSRTFSTFTIPQILAEVNASGDAIAADTTTDLFIVDTDGTYVYYEDESDYEPLLDDYGEEVIWHGASDETVAVIDGVTYTGDESILETNLLYYLDSINVSYQEPLVLDEPILVWEDYSIADNLKNSFTIDEGQHINIKSNDFISSVCQISLDWMSSALSETKENAISRIVRLLDEKGDAVFEYEYCDFEFSKVKIIENEITNEYITSLSCRVIGRKRMMGDFIEVINQTMDLKVDVEQGAEDEDSDASVQHYGSTVHFNINNGILRVMDEGYSGKEINSEGIALEGNSYKYEVEFKNNNTDGENSDITTYLDIVMQDNILDARYSSLYNSLYVSPFPVKGKEIAFTRNAEEGVIYYLKDDEEEFSYLIEPFYQYHNGVDLRTSDGISIFNLNYGYKTVYLENGLVSLGINRLNGQMYLRKWDNDTKEYITLFNLHLNKFDDVNINAISDDRIELQASDTTIIMYRGHPYVILKHETEAIGLDTIFHQVWGQKVDDYESEYPVLFDLSNTDNMLMPCVASKLDEDCVIVSEEETNLPTFDIEVLVDNEVDENTETEFDVNGVPNGATVYYLINGDEIGSSVYPNKLAHTFDKDGAYTITAVYCGDDEHSYSISQPKTIQVKPILDDGGGEGGSSGGGGETTPTGSLTLTMSYPSKMTYRDGSEVIFTLKRGGVPLANEDLEVVDFNYINTQTTDSKGQVRIRNNHSTSHPKKYKIGARYWEGGKLLKQVFNDVTVSKGTAKFTLNHTANKTGGYFSVKLEDANKGYNIANEAVVISVSGDKHKKKTNQYGNAVVKIKKTGTYKYVCTFNGNKDYKKATYKKREKITR